jgi:putative SOS response-associated peptidase YedK
LPDEQIFAFAGLYNSAGECVIITTDANPFLAKIHDRMPAILRPQDYDRWLDEGGTELLMPYAGELNAVCIAEPKPKPEKKRKPPVISKQRELF